VSRNCANQMQQNSINPTCTQPDRCWITKWYLNSRKFLQVIFLLLLLFLGCTTDSRSIHLDLLHLLVQSHLDPLLCFWSLYSWRIWWSRRQGIRRYHKGWCTDILAGLSARPWDLLVSAIKLFMVKCKLPGFGTILLKCKIIRISELSDVRL
jgi:hypothetical protein